MKISAKVLFALFLLGLSCKEEETGVCYTCCDKSFALECKPGITRSECDSHNQKKTNGYSWVFAEGKLCPVHPPGN